MVKERTGIMAALEMEPDEELNSLVQEVSGEDTVYSSSKGKNGGGTRTIIIKEDSSAGSSRLWKVLALIMFGIILLFATDTIEIKKTNKGDFKDGEVKPREDTTDNPLLHYQPVVNEEADIDTKAEAAGETMADTMTFTTATAPPKKDETTAGGGAAAAAAAGDAGDDKTTEHQDEGTGAGAVRKPGPPSPTFQYKRRGTPLEDAAQKQLTDKWGSWTLVDPKVNQRPKDDFYAAYPNRDIPRSEFPSNAWQLDKEYLSNFLTQGLALVDRGMEGILSEYGHGKEHEPGVDFEERSKWIDFTLYEGNLTSGIVKGATNGGWTTPRSWTNLKKRVLHSIMTQDSFNFVMGGHSAAAGHGNHFAQSYTMQVAWIMEPIFARLGVKHESRNFGNGGLGTAHNGIAAGSLYGPDMDLLMWDSGMTEGRDGKVIEMFGRQGILGGIKVPALWHLGGILYKLHDFANVDVGGFGNGYDGIPIANTVAELEKVSWAARYLRCGPEIQNDICKPNRYNSTCWLDRPDGFKPPANQQPFVGGRAGWHPGNREHQLTGRIIAFMLLKAIKEVLSQWNMAENLELPDSAWHLTDIYEATRAGIQALDPNTTSCKEFFNIEKPYLCTVPFKARTEFSPHAYAAKTNIRTIMPKQMLENIPPLKDSIYQPPDVYNPLVHPPPGEIEVLNIVENGVDFVPVFDPPYVEQFYNSESTITTTYQKPGKGIYPHLLTAPDGCDGTLYSWCNRGSDNNCMMSGHHDGRTGFFFDSLSGWLIVNVPKVELGYIMIKLETWHFPNENPLTAGWKEIDGEGEETPGRRLGNTHNHDASSLGPLHGHANHYNGTDFHLGYAYTQSHPARERQNTTTSTNRRQLKQQPAPYCENFRFEYAIDDRPVVSLNETEFKQMQYQMQRVVEIFTLLEEPDTWTGTKDVQVAMRMLNCGRVKVFNLNHVYWA